MFFKKKPTPQAPRQRARSASVNTSSSRGSRGVFSYHASRSASESNVGRGQKRSEDSQSAVAKRSRRGWGKRLIRTGVVLGITALFVGNLLLATSNPEVVIIGDTGKSRAYLRDVSVYEEAAKRALSESVFSTNKVTIDVKGVENSLQQSFPELADVSISLPLIGRRPVVNLQPSTSRLILTSTENKSFVLDDTGKAIASGGLIDSLRKAGLPEVQDQSNVGISTGVIVLPSTGVTFVTEVARQLKAKGIVISSMTLPPDNGELHVRLKDLPYIIKFNMRGDARVEVGSYLALKHHLDGQKKVPSEYIDVRIENRAYFK